VHVPGPAPNTWSAEVIASNVPNGPQSFALAYRGHLG